MADLLDVIADGNEAVDAITRGKSPEYRARIEQLLDDDTQRDRLILREILVERMGRTVALHDDPVAAAANARAIGEVATLTFDEALSIPLAQRDGNWTSGVAVMLSWVQVQAFAEILAPDVSAAAIRTGDAIARKERDTDARTIVRLARESEHDDKGKRKPMIDKARRDAARARNANADL